ncbi:HNH endonuclease [Candidatus Poriferisodalis sp.]|uniref:HNH endonuclease n=1 Tax=Candidatus Poriferisodalis sp. TaxID=3101277 RepID=UPI003B5B6A80
MERNSPQPNARTPAAHHIEHWVDGGPTNLDNLVLLCHRHHHHLHQHGYRMIPQPDSTWTTTQESEPKPAPQRGAAQARAP